MTNDRLWIFASTFVAAILAIHLLAVPAQSQGHHGDGHDELHNWYTTLYDKTGRSCCNMQDCRPTRSRFRDQNVEVMVDGEWTKVDPEKILPKSSPDLGSHVCSPKQPSAYPKGHIFCVVLGHGA